MKPPRTAYLLKKFPRLSETFVLNEILRQEDLDTPIRVFSRREPDDEPRHPQLADLRAEVDMVPANRGLDAFLSLLDHAAAATGRLEEFSAFLRGLVAFEHPRMHALVAEAVWLRKRTEELGIEHVHVHFATDSSITAMILQELGGPTYSITAHAKDIYRSTVDPRLLSQVVGRSKFTVTVCDANVEFLSTILEPEAQRKVRRLYNGIPLDDFEYSFEGRDENHILAVGRLVEKKGFDVLIRSLEQLRDRGRDFQATIIGQGDEREALEGMIEATGLGDRVRLLGGLDQGQVRAWMKRATVFCLPCVIGEDGNRDALPTVLLEALATGLPSISTPVTGIPEILGGGEAGVLVEQRDVSGTAAAIEALLDDEARRRAIATAGRARAEELFDGRKSAETLAEWFAEEADLERCA